MKKTAHLIASVVTLLCIATFVLSTIIIELIGNAQTIAQVKSLIVSPGLLILIPAIAVTGGTGFPLASNRKGHLVASKKKRMPFIAANGILVLIPCAIFLDTKAASGLFDTWFYAVQVIELLAGGTNLALLGMNMRDGFRLSGRFR